MRSYALTPLFTIIVTLSSLSGAEDINTDMNELVLQIRQLEEVSDLVQKEFIKPISRDQLWSGAIRGMIESLDKHSRFYTKDETALAGGQQADRGRGFGFDWQYNAEKQQSIITRIIPESSAHTNGIIAGDILLSVNEQNVELLNRHQLHRLFLETHKTLSIKVKRADNSVKTCTLERSDFTDTGVLDHVFLNETIAYIKISRFRDGSLEQDEDVEGLARSITGKAFRKQLDLFASKNGKALILDLRSNGGGSLHAAVEVADCFLNAGPNEPRVIVAQVSRNNPARSYAHTASSVNTYPHWPICVLVDEYTASSAEIVAAALQDYKRAIIVGVPSAGKTSIQETFILKDGSSIRLSVAHYQSPNGQNIQDLGLKPDIRIQQSSLNKLLVQQKEQLINSGHALPEHLQNAQDPVINKAMDVLTGILVYKQAD